MSKIIESIRTVLQQPKPVSLSGLTGIVLAALDAGAYIAKLEMRYQAKSQRLGELRRENYRLRESNALLEEKLLMMRAQLEQQHAHAPEHANHASAE